MEKGELALKTLKAFTMKRKDLYRPDLNIEESLKITGMYSQGDQLAASRAMRPVMRELIETKQLRVIFNLQGKAYIRQEKGGDGGVLVPDGNVQSQTDGYNRFIKYYGLMASILT